MGANITKLNDLLHRLEALESQKAPGLLKFNSPVSTTELEELKTILPSGLPEEIEIMLRWHNGQQQSAPSILFGEGNIRLLSAREIKEAFTFLAADISFKKSWIPLLTTESGDYVMFETEPKNHGQLIRYFHDEGESQEEYNGLAELLEEAVEILGEYVAPAPVEKFQVKEWKKVTGFEAIDLKQPRLTILFAKAEDIQPHTNAKLFVKIGEDQWAAGISSTAERALVKASENHAQGKYVKTSQVIREQEWFEPINDLNLPEEKIGIFTGDLS